MRPPVEDREAPPASARKKPHPLIAIGAVTLAMPLALTFLLGLLMGVGNDPAANVATRAAARARRQL
jgi:hypothetical protein